MARRVTAQNVANRAGVSRTTVSLVLNDRADSIPEETRRRVLAAAACLGYVPSAAGRALRKGGSDLVLVLAAGAGAADLNDYMWESFAQGFQEQGLTTVFSRTAGSMTPLRALLEELRPRVILSLVPLSHDDSRLVAQLGIPLVSPGTTYDSLFDALQRALGTTQASYLLSRGHRRLVYASADAVPAANAVLLERHSAFIAAVSASDEATLVGTLHCDPRSPQAVEDLSRQLDDLTSAQGAEPDAVAAFNDDVAAACLKALAQTGRRVPQDVAVIGVDNLALSRFLSPALTTVALDAEGAWTRQVVDTVMTALEQTPEAKGQEPDEPVPEDLQDPQPGPDQAVPQAPAPGVKVVIRQSA
nr:LacI family DNA-binding transcriptional regulator [Actinomyces sp.]